ncbi:sigma-54-dependent Fis family transcriptional regulator [Tianweitania sp. BSSL-BM11]|uniref:DNA-binding transcriptional regulator NtrC n=1 Tax=Tianweitania aestuarii TaxID=2814886 RepID=A0ABS5RVC5_9HYPH|nr:sigma-54 dependent transcriptional regulator [Tianweitania aestuarii]MBS9721011.1 sigma-54-dependent Fis family transcriptional regulator [Tianweitania aestuarii]
MAGPVLIIDDDPVQRRLVDAALRKFGFDTLSAEGGRAGLSLLDGQQGSDVAIIVLDMVMPDMDGLAVLGELAARGVDAPVIVQTAQGGVDNVVAAMRAGAFDFVVKPASPERLHNAVTNALKVGSRGNEQKKRRKGTTSALTFRDLVTRSSSMDRVLRLGQKAAVSNIPILIEGESGVGKEMVARAIQGTSDRRSKPFVTVNCGAIPDNLVESILFGHEKGSFTGATEKHAGKFVEANGGTLFLDEIGDLPIDIQVKLLRAVQTGEVDPVGSKQTIKVDIRLISATHRDLIQRVKDGLFREDLFYRLNVFPIMVPPLRQRPEDVAPLVRHFIERLSAGETKGRVTGIMPDALAMLEAYDWPGNIRQLENAVFRALVLSEGRLLQAADFPQIRAQLGDVDLDAANHVRARPDDSTSPVPNDDMGVPAEPLHGLMRTYDERGEIRSLADIERDMIRLALEHYNGQMSEVARRLGIGRSTLYRKLKEYGLEGDADGVERLAS